MDIYMLDTTVFNHLVEGEISVTPFDKHRLLAIGVQLDELRATSDCVKRARLLAKFEEIKPETILASSFAWGIEGAGWDQACWNDGSRKFGDMLKRLQELDREKHKKKKPNNQLRDILIAETAIKHGATLVSGDGNLRQVVCEFGGCATDGTRISSVL
ncbi:MAG: PIN domain-containing protein [Stellaceae bacterium]